MSRHTSDKYKKEMIALSNKISKISDSLSNLGYKMRKENPYPLSEDEVYSYLCQEAADMLNKACKHLTNNGTIK